MLFNSINFIVFLIVVFSLYWFLYKKPNAQKLLLLISSNIFYAFWDYRFLALLNLTIFIDYYCGKKIQLSTFTHIKKRYLIFSITSCLSILFIFKYFNFFIDSFRNFFSIDINSSFLPFANIILPVGISFYTFHGISYVVDIYNNKITAEKKIVNYALFVSFFPLLVAGPIERARNLLSQITEKVIYFDYALASNGLRLILIGFVKKIVLADNAAVFANEIFGFSDQYNGATMLLGGFFFAIQIYFDFSGYSDIAIGTSKLFGYELIRNFDYPYFSKNLIVFWQKWHISLSSFFRDYLYIPLGGDRVNSTLLYIRNIMVVFVLSGLWHGANYTFLLWGLFHGSIVIITKFTFKIKYLKEQLTKIPLLISYAFTFLIVILGWIIFRSENIDQVKSIYSKIFSSSTFQKPYFENGSMSYKILFLIACYFIIEFISYKKKLASPSELLLIIKNKKIRYIIYILITLAILSLGNFSENSFIYFQF
ncbi:MBOAT family O-acyltransferase [Sediminibacterium goheungense]|uniref:D-alanyl-lipoteichoic acid acyltransferase DltB (MBOAT superfamily) n=1 Tax=Sediminibacterium goheungense TaxID=1086393 RepID=A0A4R6J0A1_9BACT|nr:MBOAT family O-acyltransferase [Sediminibacterium goheungense]TDO28227.1 D-alanyl-lipoteichoic acid acyltransferase DltB (MBOAT superfamily) [Sediminibacterium goheungense]